MGSTEFAKGTWVGLELANGFKGKHNGTVEGTKYFSVNVKGQGVMVKAEKVKKRVCLQSATITKCEIASCKRFVLIGRIQEREIW